MLDIEQIIDAGESLGVEFKKQLSSKNQKSICKEIAAISTARGGLLLVGVDDDKSICGVEDPQRIIELVEQWVPGHVAPLPDIDCSVHKVNDKDIVLIDIRVGRSSSPVYTYDGTFYGRINTSSRPLTLDQVADILRGVTLEDTLASLRSGLASVSAQATSAAYAVSPGIIGQGDLATQSYHQVRARLLHELLSSPEMMALRSTIAVAESMAAVAMHSTAPAIVGQGDLATTNYAQLRDRLFAELESASAMIRLRLDIDSTTTASMITRSSSATSIHGQSELATMPYSVLVDRFINDSRFSARLANAESVALLAQSIAMQAQAAADATRDELAHLKRALAAASFS